MKPAKLGSTLVVMLLLSACADASAPLALDERVVGSDEAPGSEPDPVETPETVTGLEELEAELRGPTFYDDDLRAFEEAGFVSLAINTRYFPSEPGGQHGPGTPHVLTFAYEFDSESGADDAVTLIHDVAARPCPETCAYVFTEFEPEGVPDALGVQAIATQESITEIGDDIQPDARYSVFFADGPVAYEVTTFGPPDEMTREQVEEIAAALYERVQGAPLPDPS